jgi:Ni,Fe-hydrogenase III large subunit
MSERDSYQVSVGPIHAGVIESGHFRFQVLGERILHLHTQLGYKHRGLEHAAEDATLGDGLAYAQRACAACAVSNTVAYAAACEASLGLAPDPELRRARTVLLELERIYNHLGDIAAICAGAGFAAGVMAYAALKERAHRINRRLSGHRFLFGTVALADNPIMLDADDAIGLAAELGQLDAEHRQAWRELCFSRSLQDRLNGIGVLTTEDALRLGAVGPAARASGIAADQRTDSPELAYPGLQPAVAADASGDVASRFNQRALELDQSFALITELLSGPINRGCANPIGPTAETGASRVESPRGRTACSIERDGERLTSLRLVTGSHLNWPVLAHTVTGNLLPDFPLINKSFELCYACSDR